MLYYQDQTMHNKFPYFCLGVRHESLGMVGWGFLVFWFVFFFPVRTFGLYGSLEQLPGKCPVPATLMLCCLWEEVQGFPEVFLMME